MRIREAVPADAGAVSELLNRLIADRDGTALTEPVKVADEAEYIQSLRANGLCLLAEENGVLLGVQSVERLRPKLGEIGTFVRRESRGQGVGRLLLEETRRWAASRSLSLLLAEVAVNNWRGQEAYRAWGFVEASAGLLNVSGLPESPGKVRLALTSSRSPASILEAPP